MDGYGPWDSRGRYRLRVIFTQTQVINRQAHGTWTVYLQGQNNYTFFNWAGTFSVTLGGHSLLSGSHVSPAGSWNANNGVIIASGTWGGSQYPNSGQLSLAVSVRVTYPSSPSSYMPGSTLSFDGTQVMSNIAAITTPPAPTPLGVDQATHSSLRARFQGSSDGGSPITRWELRYGTSSDMVGSVVLNSSGTTVLTGLESNRTYYFQARGVNALGNGAWSSVFSGSTLKYNAPSAPITYGVSSTTATSAQVGTPQVADNGGSPVTNLRAQYNTTQNASGATTRERGSFAAIDLTGLSPDTQYYVRLSVANSPPKDGGWSEWGAWVPFRTAAAGPGPVTAVTITDVTLMTAKVNWASPSSLNGSVVTGYRIRIATNDSFTLGVRELPVGASTFTISLSDLTEGTKYYVQITALSTLGDGGSMLPVSFTTAGGPGSITSDKSIHMLVPLVGWRRGWMWMKIPLVGWRRVRVWKRVPLAGWRRGV